MAEKKVYLGSQGPYLYDDAELLGDSDGDLSGEYYSGIASTGKIIATEFHGIPISSISVTNIDDPSTELNPLSASTVGGLIAVYQAVDAANDEFIMYLWDTNAAAENVPYTVDGDGGTWIAVSGKYQNGDFSVGGELSHAGSNEDGVVRLATITGIDAKSVATTLLYTVPSGKTFIPVFVVIRVTAFTVGAKGVQAIASFGGNSATYDDFLNSITYTIAAVGVYIRDGVEDVALPVQVAADEFKISIETGSDATTETWAVDVFGYLY